MSHLRPVPPVRERDPLTAHLFETAVALIRATSETTPTIPAPAPSAPPRELHVVECWTDGGWVPMPGDAYIDPADAEKYAALSRLRTRVVVYVPKGDAT